MYSIMIYIDRTNTSAASYVEPESNKHRTNREFEHDREIQRPENFRSSTERIWWFSDQKHARKARRLEAMPFHAQCPREHREHERSRHVDNAGWILQSLRRRGEEVDWESLHVMKRSKQEKR
jgi:hypothetical protein